MSQIQKLNKSEAICSLIIEAIKKNTWGKISSVFLFSPIFDEPNLTQLSHFLSQNNLIQCFPKILDPKTSAMEFYQAKGIESLILSQTLMNRLTGQPISIAEPENNPAFLRTPNPDSLILIPCLAISKEGVRLGYGRGYYDRYLQKYKEGVRIAIAFEIGFVDRLPSESHDIKLPLLCHESGFKILDKQLL